MPYKYNESRRHKIKKCRYKVTNWHDYNNGLRQRGDFTIWFTEEAIVEWQPAKTGIRGRPALLNKSKFVRRSPFLAFSLYFDGHSHT
jgi:hypothetical protein